MGWILGNIVTHFDLLNRLDICLHTLAPHKCTAVWMYCSLDCERENSGVFFFWSWNVIFFSPACEITWVGRKQRSQHGTETVPKCIHLRCDSSKSAAAKNNQWVGGRRLIWDKEGKIIHLLLCGVRERSEDADSRGGGWGGGGSLPKKISPWKGKLNGWEKMIDWKDVGKTVDTRNPQISHLAQNSFLESIKENPWPEFSPCFFLSFLFSVEWTLVWQNTCRIMKVSVFECQKQSATWDDVFFFFLQESPAFFKERTTGGHLNEFFWEVFPRKCHCPLFCAVFVVCNENNREAVSALITLLVNVLSFSHARGRGTSSVSWARFLKKGLSCTPFTTDMLGDMCTTPVADPGFWSVGPGKVLTPGGPWT